MCTELCLKRTLELPDSGKEALRDLMVKAWKNADVLFIALCIGYFLGKSGGFAVICHIAL